MYIYREKAKELIKNFGKGAIEDGMKTLDPVDDIILLSSGVDLIPAADVVEVRHGKWIGASKKANVGMKCSLCGARIKYSEFFNGNHNYCHKCGAKMDGKDGE